MVEGHRKKRLFPRALLALQLIKLEEENELTVEIENFDAVPAGVVLAALESCLNSLIAIFGREKGGCQLDPGAWNPATQIHPRDSNFSRVFGPLKK